MQYYAEYKMREGEGEKKQIKILVWHTYGIHLLCITIAKNCILSPTFMCKLYYAYALQLNELSAFVLNDYNFSAFYSHILPQSN